MTKKLIEKKDFVFYIYKIAEDVYELAIPVPTPKPGFDVKHKMTPEETTAYLEEGVVALKERIEDMEKNIYNYELNSWR